MKYAFGLAATGIVVLAVSAMAEASSSSAKISPTQTTSAPNSGPITLVQQLTANLAYQLHELEEEPGLNYHYYASQRLAKQLKAAIAAAAAGHPLPPLRKEDGTVAPITGAVSGPTPAPLA